MANVPHNMFQPPQEVVHPTPDPHKDEIDALAKAHTSPTSAFIGVAISVAGLLAALLWSQPLVSIAGLLCGLAGILVSAFAWRDARRRQQPVGAAMAGLVIGVLAVLAFVFYA
jgi:1,4-dihydroxy-2-naphthoate octaprenyltransferase